MKILNKIIINLGVFNGCVMLLVKNLNLSFLWTLREVSTGCSAQVSSKIEYRKNWNFCQDFCPTFALNVKLISIGSSKLYKKLQIKLILQLHLQMHPDIQCWGLWTIKNSVEQLKAIINHQITEQRNLYSQHILQNCESAMVHNRRLECFIQRQLDTVSSSGSETIPGKCFMFVLCFAFSFGGW